MSKALTTKGLIELVDLKQKKEKQENKNEAKADAVEKPGLSESTFQNVMQFIHEYPNKLFWGSAFAVVCIGIMITEIAYFHSLFVPKTHEMVVKLSDDKEESVKIVSKGKDPRFIVFIVGFIIVCTVYSCIVNTFCSRL